MSDSSSTAGSRAKSSSKSNSFDEVLADVLLAWEEGDRGAVERAVEKFPQYRHELHLFFRQSADLHQEFAGLHDDPESSNSLPTVREAIPQARLFDEQSWKRIQFHHYELRGKLGQGGMGIVYLAYDQVDDRLVALKLSRHLNTYSQEDVSRLRFEAQAAARLDHPHIVPVFDSGEHQRRYFISMKHIVGGSLKELAIGSQSEEVSRLLMVARAVQHAHDCGILHRDLKPSNILVDELGLPHVTDFGLAKLLDSHQGLTQTGVRVGTPQYMSPEQAAGETPLTVASDIYSLGLILYERLVDRRWSHGGSAIGTERKSLPESQNFNLLSQHCDRRLQTIVSKCLKLEPRNRYESCRELSHDLDCWLRGEPISTRPEGSLARSLRWMGRHPLQTLTYGSVTTLLLLAVGLLIHNLQIRSHARIIEYVTHIERARVELLEQQPGWSQRALAAINSAEPLAFSRDQMHELNSLRANASMGLDVGMPQFSIPLENTRVVRFHPQQPWMFIAQKLSNIPGLPAVIVVVDSHTGRRLQEFPVVDSDGNDELGVTDLVFTDEGRRLWVITRASHLLAFNVESLAKREVAFQVDFTDHKLERLVSVGLDDSLVVLGRDEQDSFYLWSVSSETGSIRAEQAFPDGIADISAASDLNCVIISQPGQLCWIDPGSLSTIKTLNTTPSAGMLAYHGGLVALYARTTVFLYDAVTGQELGQLTPPPSGFPLARWDSPISFSESGELLALADNLRNQLHFWSTTDLVYLQSTHLDDSQFNNICFQFSNAGQVAASGGGRTTVFNLRGSALHPIARGNRVMCDVSVSRNVKSMTVVREESPEIALIEVYDMEHKSISRSTRFEVAGFPDYYQARIEASDNGSQLAVLRCEPRLTPHLSRYNIDGKLLNSYGPLAGFRNMAFDREGILWASRGASLFGWGNSGPQDHPWQWSRSVVPHEPRRSANFCCILSMDNQRMILGDEVGRMVCLRGKENPRVELDIALGDAPIRCAACEPNSSRLAIGDGNGQVFLIEPDAVPIRPVGFDAHWSGVSALAWTACGHLVSAGLDQTVRYWSVDDSNLPPQMVLKLALRGNVRRLFPDLYHNAEDSTHDLLMFREGSFALERLELERRLLSE